MPCVGYTFYEKSVQKEYIRCHGLLAKNHTKLPMKILWTVNGENCIHNNDHQQYKMAKICKMSLQKERLIAMAVYVWICHMLANEFVMLWNKILEKQKCYEFAMRPGEKILRFKMYTKQLDMWALQKSV